MGKAGLALAICLTFLLSMIYVGPAAAPVAEPTTAAAESSSMTTAGFNPSFTSNLSTTAAVYPPSVLSITSGTSSTYYFYFYDPSYNYLANKLIYWGTSAGAETNYLGTTNSYGQITTTFSLTGQTIYFKTSDGAYSGSAYVYSYYNYVYVYTTSSTRTVSFYFYDSSTYSYIANKLIYWGTSAGAETNYLGTTDSYGQISTSFSQTGTIYFATSDGAYSGSCDIYSWTSYAGVSMTSTSRTITFTFYDSSTWNYITNKHIYWGASAGAETNYLGTTDSYGQISTSFSQTGTIYFKTSNGTLYSGNADIYSWTTSTWVSMVATVVGGTQNDMNTGTDAGNTLSAATAVAAGTGTGYLDSADTEDYFKVYATSGQTISANMTPPSGSDFDLYIYDSSQSWADSSTHGGSQTDSVTCSATSAGYYYIRVSRWSGFGTYSMTITISGGTTQNDFGTGTDAGNTLSAATAVAAGTGTGYLDDTDTADYFKVYLTSGQTISAALTPPSGSDFDLYLYNSSQSQVGSSTYSGSTTDSVEGTATSAGYFYIYVKRYSGSGTYSLAISVTGGTIGQDDMNTGTDAGNTLSAATAVAAGTGTGYLDDTDTADYFKVYLTSGQTISAALTPPSGSDFDLYLYNSSQSQVGSSTYSGSTTDSVEGTATSAGYFYIYVKRYSGSGTYSLTISLSTAGVLAESPHPYANDFDQTWTISGGTGTENMRIHFGQLDTESGWDYVYIYDGNNNFIESYTGSYRDLWTSWVAGSSVKVRLVTDGLNTAYGFTVDNVQTGVATLVTPTGKYAVIVGINRYQNINGLTYAVNDAQDWKNYLVGKGYIVSAFLTDSQATEANIRNAVTNAATQAGSNGTLAILLSGHGTNASPGDAHAFCAYDAGWNSNQGYITGLELQSDLSNYSGKAFIFLDSCHSGGMDAAVTQAGANKTKRYMTTTCGPAGYGYDESSYGNGAWTYWYLERGLVGQGYTTAEQAYTWASGQYPYHGNDAPMQFDGDPANNFSI